MSLRETAEADLAGILEDADYGFGWPLTLINPEGVSSAPGQLVGFSNDIAQIIDPDTGLPISGRIASAVFRISSLVAAGFNLPRGISDEFSKPWVAIFDDINGNSISFKVMKSNPDRALGIVVCILEVYRQ